MDKISSWKRRRWEIETKVEGVVVVVDEEVDPLEIIYFCVLRLHQQKSNRR